MLVLVEGRKLVRSTLWKSPEQVKKHQQTQLTYGSDLELNLGHIDGKQALSSLFHPKSAPLFTSKNVTE